MADERIKQILEIILQDKASDGLKKIGDQLDKTGALSTKASSAFSSMGTVTSALGTGFAVAAGAMAAFGAAMILPIREAAEGQDEINRLNGALKSSGQFSNAASKQLLDFADSMQATTRFSDGAIKQMLALSINMGATADQSDDLVKAAANMSSALGISLETSVEALSKTLNGEAGALKKYGVDLTDLSEEALKSGEAIAIVGERFKGMAEADLNTFNGAMASTKNSFDNFLETVGTLIIESPAFVGAINLIGEAFNSMSEFVTENASTFEKAFNVLLIVLANVGKTIISVMQYVNNAIGSIPYSILSTIQFVSESVDSLLVMFGKKSKEEAEKNSKYWEDKKQAFASPFTFINETLDTVSNKLDGVSKKAATSFGLAGKKVVGVVELSNTTPKVDKITLGELDVQGETTFGGSSLGDLRMMEEDALKDVWREVDLAFSEFQYKFTNFFASAGGKLLTNLAGSISQGKEGARQFVESTMGVLADAVVPGSGPFVSSMVKMLAQEREVMKQQVKAFFDEIPKIIENIIGNLPELAAALNRAMMNIFANQGQFIRTFMESFSRSIGPAIADSMNALIYMPEQFVQGIVDNADEIVLGFSNALINAADSFVDALFDAIKDSTEAVGEKISGIAGGGSIGSSSNSTLNKVIQTVTKPVTTVVSTVGSWFGFASGGKISKVNSGISGRDVVPAKLAQGELVVDSTTTRKMESFFNGNGNMMSDALLSQILEEVKKPQTIYTTVNVGTEQLAQAMYVINRNNYRVN